MIHIDITKKLHGSQGEMILSLDESVSKGEFIALMGASGAGKTTLLRVLAGLEDAMGKISVEGEVWQEGKVKLPPQKREIGFVFQDYALFEHMSVEENLLFVRNDKSLAAQLLEMTEFQALAKRNVKALSGGQKQRVSLCRAMMKKPRLLLMDEPLSALDPDMRAKLQQEIKALHEKFGTTTIMTSHDPAEVFALADRVWIMEQGKVIQKGSVDEVLKGKEKGHSVKVLQIRQEGDKRFATVSVLGELLEIEVNAQTHTGDSITVILNAIKA